MKVFLLMKTHFIAYFPFYLMVKFLTDSLLFWNAVCRGPFSTQKDEFSHCCIEANENESRESWSIWSLFRKKYGYHNGFQAFLKSYRLEPVCCKKQQKRVPDQLLVWRTWMIANWLYMSPSEFPDHSGSILYHSKSSEVPHSTNQ